MPYAQFIPCCTSSRTSSNRWLILLLKRAQKSLSRLNLGGSQKLKSCSTRLTAVRLLINFISVNMAASCNWRHKKDNQKIKIRPPRKRNYRFKTPTCRFQKHFSTKILSFKKLPILTSYTINNYILLFIIIICYSSIYVYTIPIAIIPKTSVFYL
ncbi:unnamed protein product [Aphis gossypii]|uniref:Uncharacterized protein n=1 Tax=Aphis gossypii TaxID=80765 RepID=A0A9P0IWQ0_APHGO|nr:unnamed protein product [Aphis gossypii]